MKYFAFLLVLLTFIKSMYYGIFELKERKNKSAAIYVFCIASIGLIIPYAVLLIWY